MSSQQVTMVDASGAVPAPLHRGLPDEISIWEILVRVPPKCLLRCRAVCRAWRHATSARDFLLAHHARQPTLPLLYAYERDDDMHYQSLLTLDHRAASAPPLDSGRSVDITPFDHREGLAAADQIQPVARLCYRDTYMHLDASCDGLLIHYGGNVLPFSICNPATRQYAPLPQLLYSFNLLGMYPHSPTGEYRLFLSKWEDLAPDDQDGSYVFTIGSGQPPRHVGCAQEENAMYMALSVLFRGNLHWYIAEHVSGDYTIMVFDTTDELFWQMQAPAVPGYAELFETGGMLGIASFNFAKTIIHIWVMQDYESQVWAFKCRIKLPVEDISMQCGSHCNFPNVVVTSGDGELLVLVEFNHWLHHVDINGKLVARFHRSGLGQTHLRLKQTLVPHTFFPTLDGYVVNGSPFI